MFQKWFPLKCISFGLIFLGTFSWAAPVKKPTVSIKGKETQLPALLREVEAKYTQSQTLSADFTQIVDDLALSRKKTSFGKIYVKRPSKIRWEFTKPIVNLLVSDGNTFWYYTPPFDEGERGQVMVKKASEVKSKLANALLAGSFSFQQDGVFEQKGPSTFVLTPKKGTAGTVKQATIEINPETKLIQKVTLAHRGGNLTAITLSQVRLGVSLADDLFVFKAPPNTDVMEPQ